MPDLVLARPSRQHRRFDRKGHVAQQASIGFPSHPHGREDHAHRRKRAPAERPQQTLQDFKDARLENIPCLLELKLILAVNQIVSRRPEGVADDRHAQGFQSADLATYEGVTDCGILVGEVGNAHDQRSMKSSQLQSGQRSNRHERAAELATIRISMSLHLQMNNGSSSATALGSLFMFSDLEAFLRSLKGESIVYVPNGGNAGDSF